MPDLVTDGHELLQRPLLLAALASHPEAHVAHLEHAALGPQRVELGLVVRRLPFSSIASLGK
jgi:hypothetical protein